MQSDLRSNQSTAAFDRSLVKNVNTVHKVHTVDSVKEELQVSGSWNFPCNKQVPDVPWKPKPLIRQSQGLSIADRQTTWWRCVLYLGL